MGLRELAQKLLGQASSQVSQGGEIPRDTWDKTNTPLWDKKTAEAQRVNPFVPLSQAIGVGQWDKSRLCDHCGYPHRDADPLNPWNWPGWPDGVWLHTRCEAPWHDQETGRCT